MERAARWIANQSEPGEEIAATHSAGTTSCPVYRIEGGAEGSAPEADEKASEGSRILLVLGSSTEGEKAFDHGADPSWLSMNARPVHEQYQELLRSLARLYEAGQEVNWSSFFPNGGRCVVLPSYRWQRSPHPLLPKGSGDNGGDPKREDAGRRLRRP